MFHESVKHRKPRPSSRGHRPPSHSHWTLFEFSQPKNGIHPFLSSRIGVKKLKCSPNTTDEPRSHPARTHPALWLSAWWRSPRQTVTGAQRRYLCGGEVRSPELSLADIKLLLPLTCNLLGPHVVPLGEGGRVVSNSIFKVVYPHRNPRRASCGQTDGWAGGSCYITPRVGHKRLCTCRLSTRWKMEKVEKVVLKRRQVIS